LVATHNGRHTDDYYKYVADKLELVAYDRDLVLQQIESIRNEILTGQLKLGRTKE
jgi:hypothetical protein